MDKKSKEMSRYLETEWNKTMSHARIVTEQIKLGKYGDVQNSLNILETQIRIMKGLIHHNRPKRKIFTLKRLLMAAMMTALAFAVRYYLL